MSQVTVPLCCLTEEGEQFPVTTFLLIRHAMCDPVGRSIAGRAPGIALNETGVQQAQALADRLAKLPIAAIYSSPLERAIQTARPIAERKRLTIQPREG